MAQDEDLTPLEAGENTMFREAVEALRAGDRARARDLLTRLLKTEQNNVNYWVWLSAAVDTEKERLYCLQTAGRIDPNNTAAKRGLTLLGALPPDDAVPPFPVNKPRLWEERLAVPAPPKAELHGWENPVTRIFIILGIAFGVLVLYVGGSLWLTGGSVPGVYEPTRRRVTLTFTPTATPVIQTPTPTFPGPTPLSHFLPVQYTATPLYIATEHSAMTRASFDAGLHSLAREDYETARIQFQDVLDHEPEAADAYYFIGESYRAEGDYRAARSAYQQAINLDPDFAPGFLGRARANLALNPNAVVLEDINNAILIDPHFAEAYIERAAYLASRDPSAAIADTQTALEINPDSALAYLYQAQAQLALNQDEAALESVRRANQIDLTIVPVYLTMAQAFFSLGQAAQAVGPMQTYTTYVQDDEGAWASLAQAYNAAGQWELAIAAASKALQLDTRNGSGYLQRGLGYLGQERASLAVEDLRTAVAYLPNSFDAHLGLARALHMDGLAGDAYIEAQNNAYPLARTDAQKAEVYYWEAIFLDEMGEIPTAKDSWYRLIGLPATAMPEEWRNQAFEYLDITPTFTPTPRASRTPTATP
jgi:tetratricopeptide (TPR) repeat protein